MRKVKATLGISIVCILFAFYSCEQSTNAELGESFQKIKTVTPLPLGQNSTMELKDGEDDNNYLTVKLNDGSVREAWCLEWNERSIKGTQEGVNLYSTKGQEKWKELNYFMSIKNKLRAKDPNLTYKEIQVVIWSLIDNPSFDIDKISEYNNIDPSIYKDGQLLFDVEKAKAIIADVKNHFSSTLNKTVDSDYGYPGVTLIENEGQTILVGNETAFAVKTKMMNGEKIVDSDYSTCFDEEILANISFPNWGWTNGPISDPSGELTFDIYAGAGQCDLSKGTLVGELAVNYNGGTFTATYRMTETSEYTGNTYTMSETHLYVGDAPYPQKSTDQYTVAPGQYGNENYHDDVTEYTYEIDGLSGDIYFIAHAVVSGFNPDSE